MHQFNLLMVKQVHQTTEMQDREPIQEKKVKQNILKRDKNEEINTETRTTRKRKRNKG